MSVTIYDIAKELNLSHTTISRVLNGRESRLVSEATRQRVRQTAQRMGYRPNHLARALATGKTNQIGLIVRHLASSYYGEALRQVERQIRQSPYQVLISSMEMEEGDRPVEEAIGQTWDVDGCLVFEAVTAALRSSSPGKRVPIVGMGGFDFQAPGIDWVGVDLRAGAEEATNHLLALGCRRIAYLAPPGDSQRPEARQLGYDNAMAAAGRTPEYLVVPGQSRRQSRDFVREYVLKHGSPDGVFCFNDDLAIGAYAGFRDAGLRVPDDVALIGCDGIEDTEYLDSPLTTLVQPLDEVCALAFRFLRERLADPNRPVRQTLLPPRLVLRRSTERAAPES